MASITTFLEMGGYGSYVWPAYGVALVVLVGLVIVTVRQLRLNERDVAAMEKLRPRRRRSQSATEGNGDA